MAKLYAPPGLRSLGIEDGDYHAADDGTIEVADHHVAAARAHGCSVEKPAPAPAEPDQAGMTSLAERLAEAEARIAALEAASPARRR
jgi:hypothetical protein